MIFASANCLLQLILNTFEQYQSLLHIIFLSLHFLVPVDSPSVHGINSSDGFSVEMWVEGPPMKKWNGLPLRYDLTLIEHPFGEEEPKHQENISISVGIDPVLAMPLAQYMKLISCNDSTQIILDETFQQNVISNTSYVGLHPFTNYSVYAKACTKVGCGDESSHFYFLTDEEIPTCSPTVDGVANTSSTSMNITWQPPLRWCRNGIIINYTITLIDMETLEIREIFTSFTNVSVAELRKYHKYCVKVRAATKKGFGNDSDIECARTDEDGK